MIISILKFAKIFILFLGGLGLFLYGIRIMSEGLKASVGESFKKKLEVATSNQFSGVLVGIMMTLAMQSTSGATAIIVGLVNAGVMNLTQTVGVIMGANVGTTLTSMLVALKFTDYAPITIFIGVILILFSKKQKTSDIGQIILGFGILFMGMSVMSNSMEELIKVQVANDFLIELFKNTRNPIWGLFVGTITSAVIQSTTAIMTILISISRFEILDLNAAIFILYGTSIGSCITAIFASIGTSKIAKQTAIIHLLFNVIGSVIFLFITILPFGFVNFIEYLTIDIGQQLAWVYIILNIGTLLFLFPFGKYLVKISAMFVRD